MNNSNLEQQGWIPVRRRLPKSGHAMVLITNGKFVSVSRARILAAFPDVATHWMPVNSRVSGND